MTQPNKTIQDLTKEELIIEVERLSYAYMGEIFAKDKIQKQNDLLNDTIMQMIDAVSVLRGKKGSGVAMHVINIVGRAIGEIKGTRHNISRALEIVRGFLKDESLPASRFQAATNAEAGLLEMQIFNIKQEINNHEK